MSSIFLITVVVVLAIIGSGMVNVWRRRRDLNRVAYAIYCLGCIWALAMLFATFLRPDGIIRDDTMLLIWLAAGAIGGAISWSWWRAHQAAAAEGSSGAPPKDMMGAPPMSPVWARAVTLVWLSVTFVFFLFQSADYGGQVVEAMALETAYRYCDFGYVCAANSRAGILFAVLIAVGAGGILLFGRLSRLGIAERHIYVAAVILSPLALLAFFWASVM